ncbi:MAG: hypothetical protein QXZ17_10680 [Nitrososphaerota archaeon]
MGQFNRQLNAEREYDTLSKEYSEKLAERGFIDAFVELREHEEVGEYHHIKVTINWDELPDNLIVHLEPGVLQNLVEEATRKAGSVPALEKELSIQHSNIYKIRKGRDTISIGILKSLLDYLKIPRKKMNEHIVGIGGKRKPDQIIKPRLPFDFNSEEGAIVIAAALKDGSLCESDRTHAFLYANRDKESIKRVKEAIEKVFGKCIPRERNMGNAKEIRYDSVVIVEALKSIGIPTGEKVRHLYHVPEVIREGNEDVMRAYLYQTMMDEGSWSYEGKFVSYSQAVALNDKVLSEKEKEYLDELLVDKRCPPSGSTIYYTRVTGDLEEEVRKECPHLWEVMEESKPSFFEEEAEMIEKLCGVRPKLEPTQIYKTEGGEYRVLWTMSIRRKDDIGQIIKELGLPEKKHPEG